MAIFGCTGPAFNNLVPRAKPAEFLWKALPHVDGKKTGFWVRCRKRLQPLCAAISLFVSTTSVERVLARFAVHQNVTHGRGSRLCNECNAAV